MSFMLTNETVLKNEYQQEIAEIYNQYQEVIKPFVAQLEVMEGEFPVEILNEVRAIVGHIAKCYEFDDDIIIEKNIAKAKSHLKRCILDCYKYLCLAYSDYYKKFMHEYRYTDLSVVDNGEFLMELSQALSEAKNKLLTAKKIENSSEDVERAFDAFEEAYLKYDLVYRKIESSYCKLLRLKKKTFLVWISSAVAWIIPVILSIVLFLLG